MPLHAAFIMAAPASEAPVTAGEDEGFKWPTTFEEFSAMMVKVYARDSLGSASAAAACALLSA